MIMKAVDFEYDNQFLSDYGFIICEFDGSYGVDSVNVGCNISFNTTPIFHGKTHVLTSTTYEECISTNFDICKNPDVYDDLEISSDEFRDLMRWLNRRQFLWLCIFDQDEDYESLYFEASFNIEKIKIAEKTYGLRLTMETNSPFAYGAEQRYKKNIDSTESEYTIYDLSDEIGISYPILNVKCKSSGDLAITNNSFQCNSIIKNCSNGEIITIDGRTLSISSSDETHNVGKDFNYDFFIIGNTLNNRKNKITASMPCEIEVVYRPIIKDLP